MKFLDYEIKFGYIPTYKSGLMKRVIGLADVADEDMISEIIDLVPNMILVGLQKNYKDNFGFNYITKEGQEEQLEKVGELLDEYFDGDEPDFMELFTDLQNEMLENGFLASLFRQMKAQAEQEKAKTSTKKK